MNTNTRTIAQTGYADGLTGDHSIDIDALTDAERTEYRAAYLRGVRDYYERQK